MRRFVPFPAAIAALALLVSVAVAAPPFPSTIPLADGWRPEGIASGPGFTAYVGSLADGSVSSVNLRTGARDDEFIVGSPGMTAVGLEHEADADRLWVAGGPTGMVRVYDATSGEELESYSFGSGRFVNDIVVTPEAAYATDSFNPVLLVLPLGADGSLPAPSDVLFLPLSGEYEHVAGFNVNGIEAFAGALLIPNSTTGQLFAVNPATGVAVELLPDNSISRADGLLLVGSTLYVVQNTLNQISVWQIKGGAVVPDAVITDPNFDIPTTVAFAGGSLWAVNARFSTPPTPDTSYWITRVPSH